MKSATGGSMATASAAPMLAASRTADSAQSALRSCSSASERMRATASFVTFLASVSGRSSPPEPTTEAAPMFVFGAMAATSAASMTNVAADAARAPSGATQAMTGTSLARMALMMRSMLVSSPPGESTTMIAAADPSSAATCRLSSMNAALTWSMTPVSSICATCSPSAAAGAARPMIPSPRARAASTRRAMG